MEAESKVQRETAGGGGSGRLGVLPEDLVHACFYFLSPTGHGVRQMDLEAMRALHDKVSWFWFCKSPMFANESFSAIHRKLPQCHLSIFHLYRIAKSSVKLGSFIIKIHTHLHKLLTKHFRRCSIDCLSTLAYLKVDDIKLWWDWILVTPDLETSWLVPFVEKPNMNLISQFISSYFVEFSAFINPIVTLRYYRLKMCVVSEVIVVSLELGYSIFVLERPIS